jgi:hypothetical protein
MKRRILGLITASVTAPYLIALFWVFSRGKLFSPLGKNPYPDDFFLYGAMGIVFFGLPLLAIAWFCEAIVTAIGWRSRWTVLLTGAIIGTGFIAVMDNSLWSDIALGAVSGAICGWIYWLIAIRRDDLHPPAQDSSPHP